MKYSGNSLKITKELSMKYFFSQNLEKGITWTECTLNKQRNNFKRNIKSYKIFTNCNYLRTKHLHDTIYRRP